MHNESNEKASQQLKSAAPSFTCNKISSFKVGAQTLHHAIYITWREGWQQALLLSDALVLTPPARSRCGEQQVNNARNWYE